jgi:hypothetical protein
LAPVGDFRATLGFATAAPALPTRGLRSSTEGFTSLIVIPYCLHKLHFIYSQQFLQSFQLELAGNKCITIKQRYVELNSNLMKEALKLI